MTVPFEQLSSDIFFQQANLRAERWLGQVKTFGRTPEIEFFGDSHKVPCVTEFHSRSNGNSYNLSLRQKQSNSEIRLSRLYCLIKHDTLPHEQLQLYRDRIIGQDRPTSFWQSQAETIHCDSFSYSQRFYQTAVRPMVCGGKTSSYPSFLPDCSNQPGDSRPSEIGDGQGEVCETRCRVLAGNGFELCLQD